MILVVSVFILPLIIMQCIALPSSTLTTKLLCSMLDLILNTTTNTESSPLLPVLHHYSPSPPVPHLLHLLILSSSFFLPSSSTSFFLFFLFLEILWWRTLRVWAVLPLVYPGFRRPFGPPLRSAKDDKRSTFGHYISLLLKTQFSHWFQYLLSDTEHGAHNSQKTLPFRKWRISSCIVGCIIELVLLQLSLSSCSQSTPTSHYNHVAKDIKSQMNSKRRKQWVRWGK